MNSEQLYILAQILSHQAQVLGMQADNQAREACGSSPAWTGKDFSYHANELVDLGRRAIET